MRGAPWSKEETATLLDAVKAGKSSGDAAKLLPGRSRNSLVGRAFRLGYAFGVGHVPGLVETHRASERARYHTRIEARDQHTGTDSWDQKLFEPYAHRKLRLVRERTGA